MMDDSQTAYAQYPQYGFDLDMMKVRPSRPSLSFSPSARPIALYFRLAVVRRASPRLPLGSSSRTSLSLGGPAEASVILGSPTSHNHAPSGRYHTPRRVQDSWMVNASPSRRVRRGRCSRADCREPRSYSGSGPGGICSSGWMFGLVDSLRPLGTPFPPGTIAPMCSISQPTAHMRIADTLPSRASGVAP